MRTNTMVVAFAVAAILASALVIIDDGADAVPNYEITDVDYSEGILTLTVPGIGDAYASGELYSVIDSTADNLPVGIVGDNLILRPNVDLELDVEHTISVIEYGMPSTQPIISSSFTIASEPEPGLIGIEVTVEPTKTVYTEGDSLDLTGMVVSVVYDDGSTDVVDGYTTNPANGTVLGQDDTTVTVSYGGFETSFEITVNSGDEPVTLTGISVTGPSKTAYTVGDRLDLNGLLVTASYSDSTSKEVTGYTTSPADGSVLSTVGDETVIVTYTEGDVTKSATFTVTVSEEPPAALTGIEVTTMPKTDYFVGDEFDPTGMIVTATYDDGSTRSVTGYTISDIDMSTAGTKTVTVTYTENSVTETTTFEIAVQEIVQTGVEIVPDKDIYTVGDVFDAGVSVYALYNNGDRIILTEGYEITFTQDGQPVVDGQTLETSGTIIATVTCNGFTATHEITVREPGQVVIDVTVLGGGVFGTLYLTTDDGQTTTFTASGRIVVDEGTVVTITYDTELLIAPTLTLDGRVIASGYSFAADSDAKVMISFVTDDDDDDPVNPSTPVQDDGDDSSTYIVAIAAAAVVAILAALILMQTRRS